jgi:gluconolactonase
MHNQILIKYSTCFAACCLLAGITVTEAHTISLPASLVSADETVKTVKSGINFGEGPTVDSDGNLYFSDRNPSRIWKVTTDGNATVFRNPANDANGMVFDGEDGLIVCEKKGLSRTGKDNSIVRLLTADTLGSEGPNDLTLTSEGGIFFTSSVWNGNGKVFYLSSDGRLKSVLAFSNPPNYPNGIEYVEEKKLLYINVTQKDSIMKYRVNDDFGITKIGGFCKTPSPDGLAIDVAGNLWVANTNGNHQVTVFDSTGKKLGDIILEGQESVQNCAFGGVDGKTLYIAGKTAIYSVKTAIAGRNTMGKTRITRPHFYKSDATDVPARYRGQSVVIELFDLRGKKQTSFVLPVNKAVTLPSMPCGTTLIRAAGKTGRKTIVR